MRAMCCTQGTVNDHAQKVWSPADEEQDGVVVPGAAWPERQGEFTSITYTESERMATSEIDRGIQMCSWWLWQQ